MSISSFNFVCHSFYFFHRAWVFGLLFSFAFLFSSPSFSSAFCLVYRCCSVFPVCTVFLSFEFRSGSIPDLFALVGYVNPSGMSNCTTTKNPSRALKMKKANIILRLLCLVGKISVQFRWKFYHQLSKISYLMEYIPEQSAKCSLWGIWVVVPHRSGSSVCRDHSKDFSFAAIPSTPLPQHQSAPVNRSSLLSLLWKWISNRWVYTVAPLRFGVRKRIEMMSDPSYDGRGGGGISGHLKIARNFMSMVVESSKGCSDELIISESR